MGRGLVASLVLVLHVVSAIGAADAGSTRPATPPGRLAGVKSWGYQLQGVDPREIAASTFDLVVIDYSRNGTEAQRFSPDDIKTMQKKPNGSRRIVLAYMSIGEAEDYRYYWQDGWVEPAPLKRASAPGTLEAPQAAAGATSPVSETVRIPRLVAPGWLGRENEVWGGNYLVRFWYDGWQQLIMHNKDSYLARIQAAGFDGVYLDRVDAYYAIEQDRSGASRQMIDFVVELAAIARKARPDFIVLPQNAEELLSAPRYVAAIDGVAKEDLMFGHTGDGQINTAAQIAETAARLQFALDAGRPALVVEYLDRPELAATADAMLRSQGMIPYFAPRKLDRLAAPVPTAPAPPPR